VHRLTLALLAVGLLAAACSADDSSTDDALDVNSTTAPPPTSEPTSAPSTTAAPGCPPFTDPDGPIAATVTVAGERRSFIVDVPPAYDGSSDVALILNFHGNGSNADQQRLYTQLVAVTDAIVVAPEGTGDPQHFSLVPGPQNPDIAFARAIVDAVSGDFCVDPDRVFSTGISNGSGLSAEIACAAPDVFAAVALVAATIGPLGCDPSTRIPVLAFHGTADAVVPFTGGPLGGGQNVGLVLPSAQEGIGRWAEQNGCDPEPTEERFGNDVVHGTFSGCDADVEYHWVEGGGHVWPGATDQGRAGLLGANTQTIDASELISEWFEDHPRGA
jgi:polyhydroxybutyrate depolymerase